MANLEVDLEEMVRERDYWAGQAQAQLTRYKLLWNYIGVVRARALFGANDPKLSQKVCRVIADEFTQLLSGVDPAAHIKAALEEAQAAQTRSSDE